MLEDQLKKRLRIVPDFPKKGIQFVDITSLLANGELFRSVIQSFAQELVGVQVDYVVGVESRGFVFAAALAFLLRKPLVLARKAGKLPSETWSQEYDLEYGSACLEINKCDVIPGANYVIVDDIIATGGTVKAVKSILENHGATVSHIMAPILLSLFDSHREEFQNNSICTLCRFEE